MDNETNPSENDAEVVESCVKINENGCDEQTDETDAVTESEDKDESEVENVSENKTEEEEEEEEEECPSPKESSPVDEAPSETDQFAVIDSDPSESSPEKGACIVSSPSETEHEELGNDKSWNQLENESSPEKSQSEVAFEAACIISSPSEAEMYESANEKTWGQLNESVSEGIYDEAELEDSIDDEAESEDDEMENNYRPSQKVVYQKKEREKEQKPAAECPVFELTDDNSSVDDVRSEVDDDIEGDEMGEEEEDSDYSEVHNIDDSDDEPSYVEERNIQNVRQLPPTASSSSHSAKIDVKLPIKSYDNEHTFDEDAKFGKHSAARVSSGSSSQCRSYIKSMLQNQSASKLQRYLAVKRSIKCLSRDNKTTMRDNRGVNRMVEVLNSGIDTGSSSNLVTKSTPVDGSVLKERNINETSDSTKIHGTDAKDAKTDDDRERKSNAQSASELNIKRSLSHQSGNELMINLDLDHDLDEIDYEEKCAKALTSEGDNDSQNTLGMDVDEPSENLYVSNTARRSGSTVASAAAAAKTEEDDIDDPVTIESEEETLSKSNAPHESKIIVNGISSSNNNNNNKGSSSSSSAAEDVDKETKSVDDNMATKTTNKSNKRKISISSDDEQAPPAKNPRNEIEENFSKHDKMMRRMIESSTSANKNDPDNLQRDIDQLTNEIEALDEAARTKEIEWNNILYLKKMKEDMLLRLNRKKTVIEIMATKSIDNPESLFLNSSTLDCLNELSANESKKSGGIGPATSFIMSRCNMKSVDLAKEKSNLNELHRNIQPKSTQSLRTNNAYANVVTSIPKSSPAIQTQQQQQSYLSQRFRENGQSLLNSANQLEQAANKMQIGRQGQIKDVQSIIANFRQTHPEVVPRRGRRLKNVNQNLYGNEQGSNSAGDNTDALVADLLSKRNNDISSPPSSNDSTYSNSQVLLSKAGASNQYGSIAAGNFKQAFNENNIGGGLGLKNNSLLTSTPLFKNQNSGIGYPEVTLHPIGQSSHSALLHNQKNNNDHLSDAHTNSLLHGILTKSSKLKGSSTVTTGMTSTANATGFNNAFSPTLARLLTAPERNFALSTALSSNNGGNNANNNNNNNNNTFFSNQAAGINLTKSSNSRSQQQQQDSSKPEISCLPISQILAFQQQQQQQPQNNSLLQQQLQRYQRDINKFLPKNNVLFNLDDEADDSDRLVIDEEQYSNSEMIGGTSGKLNDDSHENELPVCQGCKKSEAQFVCADCQRQWYCSRECQVMAWDEHSEVCGR
ncbi:GATA zinc finger domain-containing protein 7-like isoform X2 [Sitodiplosis mosellana]|uniref:GATA zinc finger domain-containing protein 7-like isoform X2 n=1 Tax=Sitodiplosis mosellana TaxID=263140 RepID=UPI0024449284|nr:GATA zinc finger domain-containing protein 7-like isoform X2 [Sitodiplosis mosellana]XP_055321489.1 GATA zinc finger domain-containing protein 7-like isoform X2 [Sitodiplosis mosellana]XP_055321490.1 GATA zinc finger domain-containing protein 7-like isoform X2 [Sitodiplosis mosellana]XP_055321491.1 GATA zinc finger domain-containing protein 7-like isoform X2 [Sitodiplosis mosellana]XP_055321492.1 GATA zinc finger domain-containing protein 7-like isoform X2 [Sitodiplosis mosellana]XP_0553214